MLDDSPVRLLFASFDLFVGVRLGYTIFQTGRRSTVLSEQNGLSCSGAGSLAEE